MTENPSSQIQDKCGMDRVKYMTSNFTLYININTVKYMTEIEAIKYMIDV